MSKKVRVFQKVGKTLVVPLGLKILLIFIILIILSNIATNLISLQLTQRQIINLNNTIMVNRLKDLYTNASNQYSIYSYSNDKVEAISSLHKVATEGFENPNSMAVGVDLLGNVQFLACANEKVTFSHFGDGDALKKLNADYKNGISEGSISFRTLNGDYFGVYKYHSDWGYYLIRAEKRADLSENTKRVFHVTGVVIFFLTILFVIVGYLIIYRIFKPVRKMTSDLFDMQRHKQLSLIDISGSPNDDITYMAASFNSLSSSVNNLMGTFQKFVSKDVVAKAYSDQGVLLEGSQQELTMLFSDIKSFTYRTETLGNDIIDVLNVHYNRVIHNVHENGGVVGSIIGDAILAVYGTLNSNEPKSYNSVRSAWDITRATAALRAAMQEKRNIIEKTRTLTESEEKVFKAVMLDVGVGIDGGNVFYGNIGSNEHMANTVIGDNVNSASRLEGLTRIYHLPVIVSGYIKDEVEAYYANSDSSAGTTALTATTALNRYKFFEIDTVQVKGKTEGKKIYFPFDTNDMDPSYLEKFEIYSQALQNYYKGNWKEARVQFKEAQLEVCEVFLERMGLKSAPENWSGIWTMTTK